MVYFSRFTRILIVLTFLFASVSTAIITPSHPQVRVQSQLIQVAERDPQKTVTVIVQRSGKSHGLEEEIAALGGKIIRDLYIINAFTVEMRAAEVLELASREDVLWISLNSPMVQSSVDVVSTAWSTLLGVAESNTFVNADAVISSVFGPDENFGLGTDNIKGSFSGFDVEQTPGYVITKVDVLLQGFAPYIGHDFKIKIWLGGRQIKEFPVRKEWWQPYPVGNPGLVVVDITTARDWKWADLDNQLEVLLDLGPFDRKDVLYLDAVGLRVTSQPGMDETGGSTLISLPREAIDTSKLVNVYNRVVRAPEVWNDPMGYWQGQGVTVAVVDSGITKHYDLGKRLIGKVNMNQGFHDAADRYGHGTFVASLLAGDGKDSKNQYMGIAPKTNILNVRISDDQGMANESDVVTALQWVLENKALYNIRVANLSLNSAVPQSYHTSPLDAACEILWFNGIVVVVSAGNNGTNTLNPPANDPFVITVGATDDRGTLSLDDDVIPSFSAFGLTEENAVKPELVAPGTNLVAYLPENAKTNIGRWHKANMVNDKYFRMSGTSMSTPIVSGAVALLLQDEPSLNPDQVKYRLMTTANSNWPGYDPLRSGAGMLDVYAAVNGFSNEMANTGIPISLLLTTGPDGVTGLTVQWGSVQWGSVQWGSVQWGSVQWGSDFWSP